MFFSSSASSSEAPKPVLEEVTMEATVMLECSSAAHEMEMENVLVKLAEMVVPLGITQAHPGREHRSNGNHAARVLQLGE